MDLGRVKADTSEEPKTKAERPMPPANIQVGRSSSSLAAFSGNLQEPKHKLKYVWLN